MNDEIWKKASDHVLKMEGGYNDVSGDSGGATNFGISLRFVKGEKLDLDLDMDGDVDADDIKKLTKEKALEIYKKHFWTDQEYDHLVHHDVAVKCFDMAVNMGARQANKIIQRSANECGESLKVDGYMGSKTIGAVNYISEGMMANALRKNQAKFYTDLVKKKPHLKKFLKGWLNRAKS